MTVGELIEELQKLPHYHVVKVDVGLKYNESVLGVMRQVFDEKAGPMSVITTFRDPRNEPDPYDFYESRKA